MSANVLQPVEVDYKMLANNFANDVKGILEQDKIDAAVKYVLDTTIAPRQAHGNVVNNPFYLEFQIRVSGGQTFNGQVAMLSAPGSGETWGNVYTDDIDKLYRKTKVFMFTSTPTYLSLFFFDSDQNLLGHYEGTAISMFFGIGSGAGRWS